MSIEAGLQCRISDVPENKKLMEQAGFIPSEVEVLGRKLLVNQIQSVFCI